MLRKLKERPGVVQGMQANMRCAWRLFWWSRPHGRAFEMSMCSLKARLAGSKPSLDLEACRLVCGPGSEPFDFNAPLEELATV